MGPNREEPGKRTLIGVLASHDSRTCLAFGDFAVIITFRGEGKPASFITSFQAGETTLQRIRSGPRW